MAGARFGGGGLTTLAVNGVDLRGAMLAANAKEGGGFFSNLTAAQWVAVGFTVIVFGSVASDAVDSQDDPSAGGSGSGSGGG